MMTLNIPDGLSYEIDGDNVRFAIGDASTGWMGIDDGFIKRISPDSLNMAFLEKHLKKEIEIKNTLDDGIRFLKLEKYAKAIGLFDEVLFYDPKYGEALLDKSYSLRGQKHYVKSLRFYRRAVASDSTLNDVEYHRTLLSEANAERDGFPKIKMNIYAGDEHFAKGEFEKAVESYNRALANPSKFKDRILSRLLNKKATALLKSDEFDEALDCFRKSLQVGSNDYAIYGEGVCEHNLGLEVSNKFKNRLNISKALMLDQILILNDLGLFRESLGISDYLYENHFRVDEFYLKLLDARKVALEGLDMDSGGIDFVRDKILNIY